MFAPSHLKSRVWRKRARPWDADYLLEWKVYDARQQPPSRVFLFFFFFFLVMHVLLVGSNIIRYEYIAAKSLLVKEMQSRSSRFVLVKG